MEAFLVIPEQDPNVPEIFSQAGQKTRGKGAFTQFMSELPKDFSEKLKEHSIYLSYLKEQGNLLFAGVTDDFKDAYIVYAAEDLEGAKRLTEEDPFVKSKLFTGYRIMRLHHWL